VPLLRAVVDTFEEEALLLLLGIAFGPFPDNGFDDDEATARLLW